MQGFGGRRSPSPIRKLFAKVWQLWSLMTNVLQALGQLRTDVARAMEALGRLERATSPPGPQGINYDAWLGLRPDSAMAYQASARAFIEWCRERDLPLAYPAEIDRAVVLFAQHQKISRGKLETLTSALKRGMPALRGNLYWAEAHMRNLLRYAPPTHKTPMMRFVGIAVGHRMAMTGWA